MNSLYMVSFLLTFIFLVGVVSWFAVLPMLSSFSENSISKTAPFKLSQIIMWVLPIFVFAFMVYAIIKVRGEG